MTFVLWLFLDLVAAESLVVLVSVIFPVFVLALAVTAFANGLWMCVDGFLVPMGVLNPFWKYVRNTERWTKRTLTFNALRFSITSTSKPMSVVVSLHYRTIGADDRN